MCNDLRISFRESKNYSRVKPSNSASYSYLHITRQKNNHQTLQCKINIVDMSSRNDEISVHRQIVGIRACCSIL